MGGEPGFERIDGSTRADKERLKAPFLNVTLEEWT